MLDDLEAGEVRATTQQHVSPATATGATVPAEEPAGAQAGVVHVQANQLQGSEDDVMAALLGFSSFGSTKQQAVACNTNTAAAGAAVASKARRYRQYMNRVGARNKRLSALK